MTRRQLVVFHALGTWMWDDALPWCGDPDHDDPCNDCEAGHSGTGVGTEHGGEAR